MPTVLALVLALLMQQPAAHFPSVTSANLEGQTFTLPRDFGGERNIVFVAFLRQQQKDVDSWVPYVKQLTARTPGLEYYELPTIKQMIAPMKWVINRGMKAGIDERAARDRTITLYIDKAPFKRSLDITDESVIHVFVVNRAGDVLWRSTGRFSEDKGVALFAALGKE